MKRVLLSSLALFASGLPSALHAEAPPAQVLATLRTHCFTCHSSEKKKGDLDLETSGLTRDFHIWENVLEQVASGEMPPRKEKQPAPHERQQLLDWVRASLDRIALAQAGDPGPVVLRRLSNMEYTYTLRDLTGVSSLDPAREFPVDGAAGEGFTNAGAALVMSPALLQKYLDASKHVAGRLVLLPRGIRFSASDSARDWTEEALARIRSFYGRFSREETFTTQVVGTGSVKQQVGAVPLDAYLAALGGGGDAKNLSPRYLQILRKVLAGGGTPSEVLDPIRAAFHAGTLKTAHIAAWQSALWRFSKVGHIGMRNGPRSWQEAHSPLLESQELRVKLGGERDQVLHLIASAPADPASAGVVVWENPRLVAKGKPDLPAADLPGLVRHLEATRAAVLASVETCLHALAKGSKDADPALLALWQEYLGEGDAPLESLLTRKQSGTADYDFIKGWTGDGALSVLANSSDTQVRVPGVMKPHSVALHPSAKRSAIVAWKAPRGGKLRISGRVAAAHSECGNGVTWALEVRRGARVETLAQGLSKRATPIPLGPFENVPLEKGHAVALVIGPRDGNHSCDLTAVDLTLAGEEDTWDLAGQVSPDILAGNPNGAWHFLSQETSAESPPASLRSITEWRMNPSPALAAKVREALEQDFPLSHPLLAGAVRAFRPEARAVLRSHAPADIALTIPATLLRDAEFVVHAKIASESKGCAQVRLLKETPGPGGTGLLPELPVLVPAQSPVREQLEAAFAEFRETFPAALCYSKIVPIDEVVTLALYHREDEPLRRLMLDEAQARELDALWEELLFLAEAPLKQLDVFEQLYQYATQDRPDLVKELTAVRENFVKATAAFQESLPAAEAAQRRALLDFARAAWRRPLTEQETTRLLGFPPRLMLSRILASPAFLYRLENSPRGPKPAPVSDWELATRLSYFLWSSAPDAQLAGLAAAGTLREPAVLAAQTRRMLGDARVRRLATEFGCQWLHVRDIAALDEKSERHFPEFPAVRESMQEEVVRFFLDLFQSNGSALSLLDADHTFADRALLQHYGLGEQAGLATDGWQRVEGMRARGRGGILGFAATLAKQSGASRTSGILRGAWVCEVVLGEKLPNPPKGIPVLPEQPPEGLSERQLVERHSTDAACSNCHNRIDPYGFALEGFDAIGRARTADTRVRLPNGASIEGLQGLRAHLLETRREDFLRQFSRKLLGYALGRSVQLSDRPLLQELAARLGAGTAGVADAVECIVQSPQFREVRGSEPPGPR